MHNIELIGKTDVGLIRPNNEDTFVVNVSSNYCLVADGMGGAAAGETASHIFAQTADEIFANTGPGSEQEVLASVQKTFQLANDRILSHVAEHPEHQGMGCTAELLAFTGYGFVIGHMGDSRTYRFRNQGLKQLTKEPSPALDTLRGPVFEGDLFMLCSDGLTDLIEDSKISEVLSLNGDLSLKTEHLVDLAKKEGGKDNITVVLAKIGATQSAE